MPVQQSESIKPIHVSIRTAVAITGECKASLYNAINRGELTPIRNGYRTLLIYAELERRCAARPVGLTNRCAVATETRREKQARGKQDTRQK